MERLEGKRTPEMRQGRERLSISRPCVELALGSLAIDGYDIAATRRFGNQLAAEADRWKLRGTGGERGLISKADAHRMFNAAFGEPRKLNSLASYHRDAGK